MIEGANSLDDYLKKNARKHKLLKKQKRENKFYVQLLNGQIIKLEAINSENAIKEAEARFGAYENNETEQRYKIFQFSK